MFLFVGGFLFLSHSGGAVITVFPAAVSVFSCLKKPETVRAVLPMRTSATQSGRRMAVEI